MRRFATGSCHDLRHRQTTLPPECALQSLSDRYNKAVVEEQELSLQERTVANVGKQDAKKHLEANVARLMSTNIVQTLGTMLDTVVF